MANKPTTADGLRSAARSRTPIEVDESPRVVRLVRKSDALRRIARPVARTVPMRRGVSVLERALTFQAMLADPAIRNRAGLARHLGVSRAFVTQAMAVLDAPPDVLHSMRGADAAGRPVTQGVWRSVRNLTPPAAIAVLSESCL